MPLEVGIGNHPRVHNRLVFCLQCTILNLVGVLATVGVVLIVFGACSLATRPWPPSTHALLTVIGGGLLILICLGLLVSLCLWTGTCWPLSEPKRRNPIEESPPVILLDEVATPSISKQKTEARYLSPGLYRSVGSSSGLYAPLAQEEELTPSLRSSFYSAEDLS